MALAPPPSDEPLVYDGAAGLVDHVVAGVLGVPGLALVADLHGGAAIVTVSRVLHILDTTVRKGDLERVNICICMFYCLCSALT